MSHDGFARKIDVGEVRGPLEIMTQGAPTFEAPPVERRSETAPNRLVAIGVEMASYIASIDESSSKVAEYISAKLAALGVREPRGRCAWAAGSDREPRCPKSCVLACGHANPCWCDEHNAGFGEPRRPTATANDGTRPPEPIANDALRMCWCFRCLDAPEHGLNNPVLRRLILCPACGNKRCPRATDHRFACTGSNEVGQFGSLYATPGKCSVCLDENVVIYDASACVPCLEQRRERATVVDEPYDREGTPGRACTDCNSAWPATEPDSEPWHHAEDCPSKGGR